MAAPSESAAISLVSFECLGPCLFFVLSLGPCVPGWRVNYKLGEKQNAVRRNIRLFLFASLSCILFLSALSSTLVQSSFSLLLYFSLTCRSVVPFASPFPGMVVMVAMAFARRITVRGQATMLLEMSEMSEISVHPCQDSQTESKQNTRHTYIRSRVGTCSDFLTLISTLIRPTLIF